MLPRKRQNLTRWKRLYNTKRLDIHNPLRNVSDREKDNTKDEFGWLDYGNYTIRDSLYGLSYQMDGVVGNGPSR